MVDISIALWWIETFPAPSNIIQVNGFLKVPESIKVDSKCYSSSPVVLAELILRNARSFSNLWPQDPRVTAHDLADGDYCHDRSYW